MCGPPHRPGTGRGHHRKPVLCLGLTSWATMAPGLQTSVTLSELHAPAGSVPDNGAEPPREQEATRGRRKNRAGVQPAPLAREGV